MCISLHVKPHLSLQAAILGPIHVNGHLALKEMSNGFPSVPHGWCWFDQLWGCHKGWSQYLTRPGKLYFGNCNFQLGIYLSCRKRNWMWNYRHFPKWKSRDVKVSLVKRIGWWEWWEWSKRDRNELLRLRQLVTQPTDTFKGIFLQNIKFSSYCFK